METMVNKPPRDNSQTQNAGPMQRGHLVFKGTPAQFCAALSEVLSEGGLAEYSLDLPIDPAEQDKLMTGRILGPRLGSSMQATTIVQVLPVPRRKSFVKFECSPFEWRLMGRGLQTLIEGLWRRGLLEPPASETSKQHQPPKRAAPRKRTPRAPTRRKQKR